jgi:hypothetical protein
MFESIGFAREFAVAAGASAPGSSLDHTSPICRLGGSVAICSVGCREKLNATFRRFRALVPRSGGRVW